MNLKHIDIDEMYDQAAVAYDIIRIVYNMVEDRLYTKEMAAEALIDFLDFRGYLEVQFISDPERSRDGLN